MWQRCVFVRAVAWNEKTGCSDEDFWAICRKKTLTFAQVTFNFCNDCCELFSRNWVTGMLVWEFVFQSTRLFPPKASNHFKGQLLHRKWL